MQWNAWFDFACTWIRPNVRTLQSLFDKEWSLRLRWSHDTGRGAIRIGRSGAHRASRKQSGRRQTHQGERLASSDHTAKRDVVAIQSHPSLTRVG